ncbi:MAG: hypothetical protein IJC07_05170 [Clostridia bacterium]|nr:hypothetical protein [Clostridia bacterium]
MSTFFTIKKKCAVCGTENEIKIWGSTHAFGYCDLDFRPAEQMRSLLYLQAEECVNCGFVATNIANDKFANVYKKIVNSDEYKNCNRIKFENDVAEKFYKIYLLNTKLNDETASFLALRNAAWICDDAGDEKNAIKCRKEALKFLDVLISIKDNNLEKYILIKMDFLRRCRMFKEVIDCYKEFKFTNESHYKVYNYQKFLAQIRNDKISNYGEVINFFN